MKSFSIRMALYAAMVLAYGGVVWLLVHRAHTGATMTARSAQEYRQQLVAELKVRLQSDDPDAVQQNQITRMNLMPSPDQQTEYEKMRQERLKRQQRHRANRPGGRHF